MGLNGYNLNLQTTTFGEEVGFFDSQVMRWIRGGATIDSTKVSDQYQTTEQNVVRKIIPAGMPMAKLANGKYCPVKCTELAADAAAAATELVLKNAKNLQPGEAILVNGVAKTIAAAGIAYDTNTITLTAAIGADVTTGMVVKAADGGDADFLCTDNAEVTFGDCVVTGIDEGRVITARLPYAPTAYIKQCLNGITFR